MIKRIILSCLLCSSILFAQEETPFKKSADSIIRATFPKTRLINVDYNQSMSRDFESTLFDNDYQEGKIANQKTVNISANLPIFRTKKWTLTGSAKYQYVEFEFEKLENVTTTTLFEQNGTVDFHNFSTALSSTYFSKLFKKPVIYNASLIVDGNDKGLERIKGMIGASLVIMKTERTTMTIGAVAFIDPTAQIPFSPLFTFNHKYKNSAWEFDFIMPQRILFRRTISPKGRLSIGSEFGNNGFYVNVDETNYPSVFEYSQLEINSGLIYEHKLADNIFLTVKGGATNFISNRLTEKGEQSKDYIYKNKQDMTGYFNLGLSINPFKKKGKK